MKPSIRVQAGTGGASVSLEPFRGMGGVVVVAHSAVVSNNKPPSTTVAQVPIMAVSAISTRVEEWKDQFLFVPPLPAPPPDKAATMTKFPARKRKPNHKNAFVVSAQDAARAAFSQAGMEEAVQPKSEQDRAVYDAELALQAAIQSTRNFPRGYTAGTLCKQVLMAIIRE